MLSRSARLTLGINCGSSMYAVVPKAAGMRRLLLVDQDPNQCRRLAQVLSGLGFSLDVTDSAKEARVLNEQQRYSWSVIGTPADSNDSVALFTQLRERQTRLRGLIVANDADVGVKTAAEEAGLDIISRPINVNVLVPWLSDGGSSGASTTIDLGMTDSSRVDERLVARLPEGTIRQGLSDQQLIRIIRGVEYPFAGKDRLEMFDRDTLVRVVLLIKRWCVSRR
jgi:ActR/RegA family two-component response regulator